jgi:small conductance mechanosensitive channel
MENWMETVIPHLTVYGLKVIGAILILILGRFAAGLTRRIVQKVLDKRGVDTSVVSFAASLAYALILAFAVLASLAKFGIQTTSFVALLGAAGFAIGLALQGSLSNFAAGVLILVLRPYRTGDVVEAAGVVGKVTSIELFTTVLTTADNIKILVPNGQIYGNVIKNITANATRRLDLVVGIGYGSSIKRAHELLKEILDADDRVLDNPAPTIAVSELADSSVNLVVRPWVKKEDYWTAKFDLTEKIKEIFDENGIEIPFPQRTVHMISATAEGTS